MLRKRFIALLAGSGVMLAGPALAARPTGGIWDKAPSKAGKTTKADDAKEPAKTQDKGDDAVAKADVDANKAGATSEGAANAQAGANDQEPVNAQAGANSQGAANANPRAVEQANANSALAGGAVASTALPGLTTGLNVKTSAGASVGTVSQVVTGTDGSIRLVIVTDSNGKTLRLMPNQLSISGGVVTTTQTNVGG